MVKKLDIIREKNNIKSLGFHPLPAFSFRSPCPDSPQFPPQCYQEFNEQKQIWCREDGCSPILLCIKMVCLHKPRLRRRDAAAAAKDAHNAESDVEEGEGVSDQETHLRHAAVGAEDAA